MEFHLSYLALRRGPEIRDSRELRSSQPMFRVLETTKALPQDDYFYEAQISLLLVGVDEWFWTAYCCVDTFFRSERSPELYDQKKVDGPTGAGYFVSEPIWNPREYFLVVLSRRMNQITKEWKNVVSVLEFRLQSYIRHYVSQTWICIRGDLSNMG